MIGSLCYDKPEIQKAILKHCKCRNAFYCDVFVDGESFRSGLAQTEKARLLEFKKAGVVVHLCQGRTKVAGFGGNIYPGKCHVKLYNVNNRAVDWGSANATNPSRKNIDVRTA